MKLTKLDAHSLVVLVSAFIFLIVGAHSAIHSSIDFAPPYGGARCLLHGCNPYEVVQWVGQYLQGGGPAKLVPPWTTATSVYPPSTLLVLSPLGLISFPVARMLWVLLSGSLYVTAVWVTLAICPQTHRWIGTLLGSVFLITSGELLGTGNPVFLAVALVAIGSFLFLRARYIPLATLSLTLSLAVKPQIGGLIVLYLLLRKIHWRSIMLALTGALVLLLLACLILEIHPQSRDWASRLRANQADTLKLGRVNDPRPANAIAIGDANLQTITSIFFVNPTAFNDVAYGVFAVLLSLFIVAILKAGSDGGIDYLALGALSGLSLLAVYHRHYDTRLLLLAIPSISIVFQKRRFLGAVIAATTVLSITCVQCRLLVLVEAHAGLKAILQEKFLFMLLLRQQNLALLLLCCLYVIVIFTTRFAHDTASEAF